MTSAALTQPGPSLARWAVGLYVVALVLRLWFVWSTRSEPALTTFIPDVDDAITWEAARLIAEEGADAPAFERKMLSAPLASYVTALGQLTLGQDALRHRVASAIIHSLRFPLLFIAAWTISRRVRLAAIAVGLVALLPACIFADGTIGKVSLELTIATLLIVAVTVVHSLDLLSTSRRRGVAVVLGLALGTLLACAYWCQLLSFVWALPVMAAVFVSQRASRVRSVIAVVASTVVLAAAVLAWNARADDVRDGTFLPRAGVDFAIALSTEDGTYKPIRGLSGTLVGHTFESRFVAELALGRPLTPAAASAYHRDEGLRQAAEHPRAVLRGLVRKAALFVSSHEVTTELDPLWFVSLALPLWGAPSFPVLLGLAAIGGIATWRSRKPGGTYVLVLGGGLLLAVFAANLAGYVSWRYRLPAVVPASWLAAEGLRAIVDAGTRRARAFAIGCALTVVALGALPVPAAISHRASSRRVRTLKAAAAHSEALRGLQFAAAKKQRVLGLSRAGLHTQAFRAWTALAPSERDVDTERVGVRYLAWLGAYDEAAALLRSLPDAQANQVIDGTGGAAIGDVLRAVMSPSSKLVAKTSAASDARGR